MSKLLLNLSHDTKELCEPYFKQLGLDHLNYIHRSDNGQLTYLCSSRKWLEHYFKKSYPKIGAFEQNTKLSSYSSVLWNGLDNDDRILIDSKDILGVEYGIAIVKRKQDGFGFYNLGTKSSDPSIINKYINELDSYENFLLIFQEKARAIIHTAKKLKLRLEDTTNTNIKSGYQFGNLYLTKREFQCINYLIRGKTAEEISVILNISKRTAETHIKNIKEKMNCFNQFRLGYLLGRMGINPI